ncbi:MAG TPA: BatD family protein, partial [Verrucomicrobiae bacterium]|nr:BatD family protein [Verrucomicrobiae bacterium]
MCASAGASSAVTVTAGLDRNPITLGETATFSLTFEGGSPSSDPTLPAIPNLQFSYIGPSSQFSVINGQVSSSVTYNFALAPQQPGDFTIPPISAIVAGQKLTTQPIKLTVLKPGASQPRIGGSDADPAFFKLVVPKRELFLGETVPVELQLYLNQKVQNFGNFRLTAVPADGFNVGKMAQGQRRNVQIGNSVYSVIPIEVAVTPIKAGASSIGPVTASLVVELQSAHNRDPIWDPWGWGGREQRTVSLATDQASIQVLPVPSSGVPPGFNGAIGDFSMNVSAGPTNVAVGDPITIKVQIAGTGTLD